jgi:gas vesicle protein
MKTMLNTLACRAYLLVASAVALVILLRPSFAFAAAEGGALSNLSEQIMNILVPLFVAFIGSLATWLLHKVQKKFGIEVGQKTANAWENLARKAALRGAEYARKKSKELTEGVKLPGGEVMEVAANWAIEMAKQQKLPELAREKLEGLIEAQLFQLRWQQSVGAVAADPYSTPPTV